MPFRVCRHIKTNGLQCQSPAMRGQPFCYFHDAFRRRTRTLRTAASNRLPTGDLLVPAFHPGGDFSMEPAPEPHTPSLLYTPLDLGPLEDPESVQVAISTVVNALAADRIEMRRATSLLYGLQLAAINCRNLPSSGPADPESILRETVLSGGEPIALPGLRSDQVWIHADDDEEEEETGDGQTGDDDDEEEEEDENIDHAEAQPEAGANPEAGEARGTAGSQDSASLATRAA